MVYYCYDKTYNAEVWLWQSQDNYYGYKCTLFGNNLQRNLYNSTWESSVKNSNELTNQVLHRWIADSALWNHDKYYNCRNN